MKDLKVRFHFLRQNGEESFHPFGFGCLLIETDSDAVNSDLANSHYAPFFLMGVTEILLGLRDLLTDKRKKKYASSPIESGFDLVFERRKNNCLAFLRNSRLIGVYPESQIYTAFKEAANQFATEYLPHIVVSDGHFDIVMQDVVDAFSEAMQDFNSLQGETHS